MRVAQSKTKQPGKAKTLAQRATTPASATDESKKLQRTPAYAAGHGSVPLAGGVAQTKVAIGAANDPFEREADSVADQVTAGASVAPDSISSVSAGALAQNQPETEKKSEATPVQKQEDKEEKPVQMAVDEKKPEQAVQKAAVDEKKPEQAVQKAAVDEKKPEQAVQKAAADEKKPEAKPIQKVGLEEKKPEEKPVQKAAMDEKKPESKPVQKAGLEEKKPEQPVQRQAEEEEEPIQTLPIQREENKKEKPVQTDAEAGGGAAESSSMSAAADHAIANKGAGNPINPDTRGALESRMGVDLGHVRVHDDSESKDAASALNARAFTHQNDIWLGRGASQDDTRLMAHEATHVIQQSSDVQRQLIQRAPENPAAAVPGGAQGNLETGLLDPAAKKITFKQIEIPDFKKKEHRGLLYDSHKSHIRKRDFKRGEPAQRAKWREQIKKDKIRSVLEDKAKAAKKEGAS